VPVGKHAERPRHGLRVHHLAVWMRRRLLLLLLLVVVVVVVRMRTRLVAAVLAV